MSEKATIEEFQEAFAELSNRWPAEIDVSECIRGRSGGAQIPNLTRVHDDIEKQIDQHSDDSDYHLKRAMEFAIYTQLHLLIRADGRTRVGRSEISFDDVRRIFDSYDSWHIVDGDD